MKKRFLAFVMTVLFVLASSMTVYPSQTAPDIVEINLSSSSFPSVEGWDDTPELSVFSVGSGDNRRSGLADAQGNVVVPATFARITHERHVLHTGRWRIYSNLTREGSARIYSGVGYLDLQGNVIVPPVYDHVERFDTIEERGFIHVAMGPFENRRWGVVDTNTGVEVVPPIYDVVRTWDNFNIVRVARGRGDERRWGAVCTTTGSEVVPVIFHDVEILSNELIAVDYTGRRGFSNDAGEGGGSRPAEWGLVDIEGNTLLAHTPERFIDVIRLAGHILNLPEGTFDDMPSNVQSVHWNELRSTIPLNQPLRVYDFLTGTSYYVSSISNGNHADVVTVTAEDTALLLDSIGGRWTGEARPVWVVIGDRTIAASLWMSPHAQGHIPGYGQGHLCLHFYASTTHNTGQPTHHSTVLSSEKVYSVFEELDLIR